MKDMLSVKQNSKSFILSVKLYFASFILSSCDRAMFPTLILVEEHVQLAADSTGFQQERVQSLRSEA